MASDERDDPKVGAAKSLVSAILAGSKREQGDEIPPQAPLPTAGDDAAAAAADDLPSDEEIVALLEVFFELEEPMERDAVLERLLGVDTPVVHAFLQSVLAAEEDDYLRARAAAGLARRGDAAGIAAIEADYDDPDEPWFFENAVQTLCEVRGAAFYETLQSLWRDPEADSDKRREAMFGMEQLDLPRALDDFVALIRDSHDLDTLEDDLIEAAMLAFVRHQHDVALAALEDLRGRILASDLDPEDAQELAEMVGEGMTLLSS